MGCISFTIIWTIKSLTFHSLFLQYGPVFTVFALGNRFTFVTEEEGIEVFFTSKDTDFGQAVQQTVQRTTSVPAASFYQNYNRLYSMMKGKMSTSNLYLFAGTLCKEFHEHMDHLGTAGTENLGDLIRYVTFTVLCSSERRCNLGCGIPDCLKGGTDRGTEVGLTVTECLPNQPPLPGCIGGHLGQGEKETLLQHLLDNLQGKHLAPNYALLLLWASQANAIPVAFWTLAFILSHPSIYKNIMEDIVSVFGKADKDKIEVSEDDLKKLLLIKWCTLEAIRLRSPGAITKKVVNPIKIQTFTIPAGDMLMLSPYWVHRNPKYFPDPETFKPDRWKEANLEKNAFLDGFMAFGGGNHQCPGRWLAIMEVHMVVILFLYKYEFILLDPVPKEVKYLFCLPLQNGQEVQCRWFRFHLRLLSPTAH
uniref:Lanosterol 14-alpha demethylase n=1 Tax=Pelusios castaneus TaxID=367368 RepID=A0A8C8VHP5_9SAUR